MDPSDWRNIYWGGRRGGWNKKSRPQAWGWLRVQQASASSAAAGPEPSKEAPASSSAAAGLEPSAEQQQEVAVPGHPWQEVYDERFSGGWCYVELEDDECYFEHAAGKVLSWRRPTNFAPEDLHPWEQWSEFGNFEHRWWWNPVTRQSAAASTFADALEAGRVRISKVLKAKREAEDRKAAEELKRLCCAPVVAAAATSDHAGLCCAPVVAAAATSDHADYASRVAAVAAGASADPADIAGAVAAHASTVGAGRAGTGDDAAAEARNLFQGYERAWQYYDFYQPEFVRRLEMRPPRFPVEVRISLIRSIRTDAALETTVKAEKRFTTCPEKVNEEVIEQHFALLKHICKAWAMHCDIVTAPRIRNVLLFVAAKKWKVPDIKEDDILEDARSVKSMLLAFKRDPAA
eukprot:s5709_g2.t1